MSKGKGSAAEADKKSSRHYHQTACSVEVQRPQPTNGVDTRPGTCLFPGWGSAVFMSVDSIATRPLWNPYSHLCLQP